MAVAQTAPAEPLTTPTASSSEHSKPAAKVVDSPAPMAQQQVTLCGVDDLI